MSLLSETFVHVLSANQTVAGKLVTDSLLPGQVNVSSAEIVVTTPLSAGTYSVRLDIPIPPNAFVYMSIFDVIVPLAGSATTIGVGTVDNGTNLTNGALALATFNALFNKNVTFIELVSSSVLNIGVVGGNLTAGSMAIKVLWV